MEMANMSITALENERTSIPDISVPFHVNVLCNNIGLCYTIKLKKNMVAFLPSRLDNVQ